MCFKCGSPSYSTMAAMALTCLLSLPVLDFGFVICLVAAAGASLWATQLNCKCSKTIGYHLRHHCGCKSPSIPNKDMEPNLKRLARKSRIFPFRRRMAFIPAE